MGRTGTHHCAGANVPVGDIPAGNCRRTRGVGRSGQKLTFCATHQRLCPNCGEHACLKTEICAGCQNAENMEEKRALEAKKAADVSKEEDELQAFLSPPKGRKKLKN